MNPDYHVSWTDFWKLVLREIEEEDEAWENAQENKPNNGERKEVGQAPTVQTPNLAPVKETKPKSNAPVGFY